LGGIIKVSEQASKEQRWPTCPDVRQ